MFSDLASRSSADLLIPAAPYITSWNFSKISAASGATVFHLELQESYCIGFLFDCNWPGQSYVRSRWEKSAIVLRETRTQKCRTRNNILVTSTPCFRIPFSATHFPTSPGWSSPAFPGGMSPLELFLRAWWRRDARCTWDRCCEAPATAATAAQIDTCRLGTAGDSIRQGMRRPCPEVTRPKIQTWGPWHLKENNSCHGWRGAFFSTVLMVQDDDIFILIHMSICSYMMMMMMMMNMTISTAP